jgi:hypothetical protein
MEPNRENCLEYIAGFYKSWPTSSDTTCVKYSHCGYDWKQNAVGMWNLINIDNEDIITQEDFTSYAKPVVVAKRVWVSFNVDGLISNTTLTLPSNLNDDGHGNKWSEFNPPVIHNIVSESSIKTPDNQKEIIYELLDLTGDISWEVLAIRLEVPVRALKTYRMPEDSTNFRAMDWRILRDVLKVRYEFVLKPNEFMDEKTIHDEAIFIANKVKSRR